MELMCNVEVWHGLDHRISQEDGCSLAEALSQEEQYRKEAIWYGAKHPVSECVLYSVRQYDEMLDIITTVSYFKGTDLTYEQLWELADKLRPAEFGVIHSSYHKSLCKSLYEEERSKRIVPLTVKEANSFVKTNHRHHDSVAGCKFAIGVVKTLRNGSDKLIGCAICGRPVSRHLDDGLTLEINRVCTTESGNVCSMLYGACARIAKDMGYRKIITYTLESEDGTSLKASGFYCENEFCGGKEWTGKRTDNRKRTGKMPPKEMKQKWARNLNN